MDNNYFNEPLEHDGQLWLTAEQLGENLGLENPTQDVYKLYMLHVNDFYRLSKVIPVTYPKYLATTRVFSLHGCLAMAFLVDTPKSRHFRRKLAMTLQKVKINQAVL